MKVIKCLAVLLMVCMTSAAFPLKKKSSSNQVYVMGVSISFKDTVVYMTDVQMVEGAKIQDKFLVDREEYSNQLYNYLKEQDGNRNHTCITFFSDTKEKLQKKASNLTKKYNTKHVELRTLSKSEFSYTKPEVDDEEGIIEY